MALRAVCALDAVSVNTIHSQEGIIAVSARV